MKTKIDKYILKGKNIEPIGNLIEWAKAFEISNRRVARYEVNNFTISTVFLGIDHRFGEGPPLLFETMVFGGPLDQEMDRYSTWNEAEVGHNEIVLDCIKASLPKLIANLVRLLA